MNQLATQHPAEVLNISPEALEVANCYLQTQNIKQTAQELEITEELVSQILGRKEVAAYVNQVFLDLGFNNRFKLRRALDAVIEKKFEDMDEAGIGSGKDIMELLALSHKMTMDELARQIELKKLEQASIKTQTNIQINQGGSNYADLLQRIMGTQSSSKVEENTIDA